jgi:hypothetical protein
MIGALWLEMNQAWRKWVNSVWSFVMAENGASKLLMFWLRDAFSHNPAQPPTGLALSQSTR